MRALPGAGFLSLMYDDVTQPSRLCSSIFCASIYKLAEISSVHQDLRAGGHRVPPESVYPQVEDGPALETKERGWRLAASAGGPIRTEE